MSESPLGGPGVEFSHLARSFCSDLEAGGFAVDALLSRLVELIGAATKLPETEGSEADYPDAPDLAENRDRVVATVAQMVGPHDHYWEVFDPREKTDPVAASLSDDIADIWRDLQAGVDIAEAGDLDEAVWQWRFGFHSHWGNHATDAIRVLHRIVADQKEHF